VSASQRAALGAEVRRLRTSLGWSQGELAERAGIAQTTVSAVERGRSALDDERWAALVEVFTQAGRDVEGLAAQRPAVRHLRGAAQRPAPQGWPLDPHTTPRATWVGAVRRHHGLRRDDLAARLGVTTRAVSGLEDPSAALPAAIRRPSALGALAALGGTDQATLRGAWQADEVDGVEHLLALGPREVAETARDELEILRWLLAVGRTQTEIARACGVSRPAVHQWVAGATRPSASARAALRGLLMDEERSVQG
jgi:transcriptional regulator with XRE-family HTH domain